MTYISLGVLALAMLLFCILFLLKRKFCPEKEGDEIDQEAKSIEVASAQKPGQESRDDFEYFRRGEQNAENSQAGQNL